MAPTRACIPWQNLVGSRSGVLLGHAAEVLKSNKVYEPYVLLFNPGQHDEGVYTLQGGQESVITTYVLAFEQQDEADRFAMLLQVRTAALLLPHLARATNALRASLIRRRRRALTCRPPTGGPTSS